jgi:hypothetical protein
MVTVVAKACKILVELMLGFWGRLGRSEKPREERSCATAAPVNLWLRDRYAEAEFERDRTKQAVERVLDPSCSGGPRIQPREGHRCSFR